MNEGIYLQPDSGLASGNITGDQDNKRSVSWFLNKDVIIQFSSGA